MSMKYVKAYYDWITVMEPLSDAERGRLMTAALTYASTGEPIPLCGAEKYVFPTIRLQIDRDRESYEEISAKRSAAGSLGGRPKAKHAQAIKANAYYEKQTRATTTKTSHDQDKDQDQDQSAATAAEAHGSHPLLTDAEMDALAADLNEVLNAAERAAYPQTTADYDMACALVAEYGAPAVLNAVQVSVGRPQDKRHWGYVKGILEKDAAGGSLRPQETEAVRPRFVNSGGKP